MSGLKQLVITRLIYNSYVIFTVIILLIKNSIHNKWLPISFGIELKQ